MKFILFFSKTKSYLTLLLLLLFSTGMVFSQDISTNTYYPVNNCKALTFSQGGWGSGNNNWQTNYLNTNFNAALPNGLELGCASGYNIKLTSAQAVIDFLPSGGSSVALTQNYINPGNSYNNTLAGQIAAVALSVIFDAYDESFSNAPQNLGDFVFISGPFVGKTVNQFLQMANNALGGCGDSGISLSTYTQVGGQIIANYDAWIYNDTGLLTCCILNADISCGKILCYGGTTNLHLNITNGSANTSVSVQTSDGSYSDLGNNNYQVSAGSYTFIVKDGNCEKKVSITVTEPSKLEMEVSATPILCNGGKSTVTVSASGGTAPYSGTGSYEVMAGTYSYTVKDANGCEVSKEITISEPSKLMMEVSATPILCNGGKSTVTVSASGGTAPYTGVGEFQVSAGTYTYTVKDAKGCEVSKEITISEPSKLEVSCSSVNAKCNGEQGSITVSASGGTAPYRGTGTFNVLAGTYTYTVTDANGCSASTTCTVTEPEKLVIKVEYTPILCYGSKSTVTVSASGGTAPYTGTGTFEVVAGTYNYTVTDANGCSDSASITITQPSALSLTITADKVMCYGGKVNVTANVTGGTSPYKYLWSTGEISKTISLGVGNYTVTVTDANGCVISKNVEVKAATCDGFTTVTQGGWGAKAAGNNWGSYRDKNFAAAFPLGLMVGTNARNIKLTSAKAVDDFLPSGSTPRALDKSYVNPGGAYSNVFAGQVVALTLNVRFDEWDANFSYSSATKLRDLIVNFGTFAGWTVYQVLGEANKVLAGEASMYSASELNSVVDTINRNYDGGKVNLGYLSCPCPTVEEPALAARVSAPAKAAPEIVVKDEVLVYPNPSSGEINVRFDAKKDSKILVQIYNAQGILVGDFSNKVVRNANKASLYINNTSLAAGLYLVKVKTSTSERTIKLIIRK